MVELVDAHKPVELATIKRKCQSGWEVVRMQELRLGDVFVMDDKPGWEMKADSPPYLRAGVWGIDAKIRRIVRGVQLAF